MKNTKSPARRHPKRTCEQVADLVEKAKALRRIGLSYEEIAFALCISKGAVGYYLTQHKPFTGYKTSEARREYNKAYQRRHYTPKATL